jgi:signal transduction histidine kinase
MPKRYIVRLSQEERQNLQDLVSTGRAAYYKIKHANILLNIDINGQGWTDSEAAKAFSCHRNTIANLRERLVKVGLEVALERQPRKTPPRQRVCDGVSQKIDSGGQPDSEERRGVSRIFNTRLSRECPELAQGKRKRN